MKYIIRMNPKAVNPLTRRVDEKRLWEVEQVGNRDSERVIWHCADVQIDSTPIHEIYQRPAAGTPPWQIELPDSICVRGADNAIVILTGRRDVSGT